MTTNPTMNLNTQPVKKVNQPATEIPLYGHHLIEASAGTGKTWTLSGIVLRLLIEGKRQPEQIICSTFTRAAASELRERIYGRLLAFNHALEWLLQLLNNPVHQQALFNDMQDKQLDTKHNVTSEIDDKKEKIKTYLLNLAEKSGIKELNDRLNDKVNLHLLIYLIEHQHNYPLTEAIRRTRHLLTTLDKLFVNTLDSLAQNWLSEFANETGHDGHIRISNEQEEHINSIIHDHIREFYTQLYHDNLATYQVLTEQGLYKVSDFCTAVERGLSFLSAPIDEIDVKNFDFKKYDELIHQIKQTDLTQIRAYFDKDHCKKQKMSLSSKLYKNFSYLEDFLDIVINHPYGFEKHLAKKNNVQKFWQGFEAYLQGKKVFNNNSEQEQAVFESLTLVQQLKTLYDYQQKLTAYMNSICQQLIVSTTKKVREQLPKRLEELGETTFSLQMQKLNHALLGSQGENLAKMIRHRYPIALIDESQDINGEQATVIQQVYLSNKNNHKHAFLLLVGDPKQAIYGFRGGDVANYNQIKTYFTNSTYNLVENFRSTQNLINSLNHWFGQNIQNTETNSQSNAMAHLGDGIYYQRIQAYREQDKLYLPNIWQNTSVDNLTPMKPVSIIHAAYESEDIIKVTARHIVQLLHTKNSQLDGRAIKPSDIAVLARKKNDLDSMQKQLAQFNVTANKTMSINIFNSIMAEEILAILQALQSPYNQNHINRTLISQSRAMTLEQVKAWQTYEEDEQKNQNDSNKNIVHNYEDYQKKLNEIKKNWQKKGILSVLNEVLLLSIRHPQIQNNVNVWQTLSQQKNAKRLLLDLRQLLDIIGKHTKKMGEFEVVDWLSTLIESPPAVDWAEILPLADAQGVKLMTMHGSKGLEFPIVYVLGMTEKPKKNSNNFYLYGYTNQKENKNQCNILNFRRLSATPHQNSQTKDNKIANSEYKENFDELKRLFYVAMTRASEQLFISIQDLYNKSELQSRPINHWLQCLEDKNYQLPERLQSHIGWIDDKNILEYGQLSKNNHESPDDNLPEMSNHSQSVLGQHQQTQTKPIDYPDYHSVIKQTQFFGWGRTSFTALSRFLEKSEKGLNDSLTKDNQYGLFNDDILNHAPNFKQDEMDYPTNLMIEGQQNPISITQHSQDSHIRFEFIKGRKAGSFLHKVLESLPTYIADESHIDEELSKLIDKHIREYKLPKIYLNNADENSSHEQLKKWLQTVIRTPFVASDVSLINLPASQIISEMSFNMGMQDNFDMHKLANAIAEHLPDEPDKHINFIHEKDYHDFELRYLKGEIDLVYKHDGKFFLLDYKSNYLGNQFKNYHVDELKTVMNKSGYWLQAMIYQVALHRLLKMRLKNYIGHEKKYLGAVEYVFLRGFGKFDDNATIGSIHWQMPISLIYALDKLL